jgi:hypothetical protein
MIELVNFGLVTRIFNRRHFPRLFSECGEQESRGGQTLGFEERLHALRFVPLLFLDRQMAWHGDSTGRTKKAEQL